MVEESFGRCVLCGKPLHDPFSIYCAECQYELRRVRLADEEPLEEWLERLENERKKMRIPPNTRRLF